MGFSLGVVVGWKKARRAHHASGHPFWADRFSLNDQCFKEGTLLTGAEPYRFSFDRR
jgi:hypothetical protein